jgi:hypothetical protein
VDVVGSGQREPACGQDFWVEDLDYVSVFHDPGSTVDKAVRLCVHHWIEGGVCDNVLQYQSWSIALDYDCGCGCDYGKDLDCRVGILGSHRRIGEVAQARENENEMTNNGVGFVGGMIDGGDRIMENGLYPFSQLMDYGT